MYILILYASYLSFPFLIFLIFILYKKRKNIFKNKRLFFITVFFLLLSISFIYSRFIERYLIFVKTTEIETGFLAKIVVISDIHLGVYKKQNFLKRVVKKINEIEEVDAVLIPGDFTYYPNSDLGDLFQPLSEINVPVYAVLGNHDDEKPGPAIQEELQRVLEKNGVIFLENTSSVIKDKNIKILGLGDKWADKDNISLIDNFSENDNLIVLTHNPDTAVEYNNSIPDLTVSGHAHGGQIRLPFIYKSVIPCEYEFDQGLYELTPEDINVRKKKNTIEANHYSKVFVSAGIGEVGLPMRLGIPPTIEVLELR